MTTTTFSQTTDERVVQITVEGDKLWDELTDEFVCFLRAVGYQVTREELSRYLRDDRHDDLLYYNFFNEYGDMECDKQMHLWNWDSQFDDLIDSPLAR